LWYNLSRSFSASQIQDNCEWEFRKMSMGGNDTDMQSMSLEEARSVLWLRNNPRPLGELLDKGYLNKRRLQWAAERAYDPRLRAAAQGLSTL
jgi:hypothetical protein